MIKKLIAALMAVTLVSNVFTGCGKTGGTKTAETVTATSIPAATQAPANNSTSNSGGPKDFVKLAFLMPGDQSKRMAEFAQKEFAEKMKAELNCQIDFTYVPWGNYWDKLNIMLASGQPMDLFWSAADMMAGFNSKKYLMPLDELLEKQGPELKKHAPAKYFENFKIDGKLMAIPGQIVPVSGVFYTVLVRQDILEEVGMKEIKTLADLEQFYDKVKAKYPDMIGTADIYNYKYMTRELSPKHITFMNPSFENNNLAFVDDSANDDKVYSWLESPEYKQYAETMFKWKSKGIIPDFALTNPNEQNAKWDSGKMLWKHGSIGTPVDTIDGYRTKVPKAKLAEYCLTPEKPRYITEATNNIMHIPAYSKNAERTMMFMNWIFKSQDNYNFVFWGVKDKDYKLENDRLVRMNTDDLFYEWMWTDLRFKKYSANVDEGTIKKYIDWDKDAKYSKSFGFNFNQEPVKSEAAKINAVLKEKFDPISAGYVEFGKNYQSALKELKNAGLDKYMAELQKQFSEYKAKNK